MDRLIERLEATKTEHRVRGLFGGMICIPDESETRQALINPDGPEAAAMLRFYEGELRTRIWNSCKARNMKDDAAILTVETTMAEIERKAAAQWLQAGREGEG